MDRNAIERAIAEIETIGQSLDVPSKRRSELIRVAADLRHVLAGLPAPERPDSAQYYGRSMGLR